MLGKSVDVLIDGSAYSASDKGSQFCAPFFCGHIVDEGNPLLGEDVYVISNNPEEKFLRGVVVAISNKNMGKKEKIIVAPKNAVFYSPEIRNRLSRIRNHGSFKLNCLYEKSCGAIIYHVKDNQMYFLLVKNTKGKHWGFPKGHIEVGETEEQTAKREVKEETGLDVTILRGFRKKSYYRPFGKIRKKVVIFLAKAKGNKVKIQDSEIECYKWAKTSEVLKYLRYPNDISMFKSALSWLNKNKN